MVDLNNIGKLTKAEITVLNELRQLSRLANKYGIEFSRTIKISKPDSKKWELAERSHVLCFDIEIKQ